MPQRHDYQGLTLAEVVLALAEHPGAPRTRHISVAECELLVRAAEVSADHAPSSQAFA